MTEVKRVELAMPVVVRKHEVDKAGLQTLLRSHKKAAGLSNKQIASLLVRPATEVEHWFRTDACWSVPDADIWTSLKAALSIETNEYDAQVTEFIEQPGVFEKANRFYFVDGIAPTLTVASADEKIIFTDDMLVKGARKLTQTNVTKYEGKTEFTYASAFAGIGGMTLGLSPLGGQGVAAWEYDPTEKRRQYAQDAHKLLHPEIPIHGDICETNTDELPDFDVFCFTPPCQSFSVAGKRGGFADTRGTLTFEALRIADAKNPKILFMENVKGIVNHDKGNTMGTIVHAINEIGYTVDFTVVNSKYFDVAQNRERVYLIAVRDDLITPEPWKNVKGTTMLPKAKRRYQEEGAKTFNFDWPEQTEVRTRLRDFLEDVVDEKYYLSDDKTAKLVSQLEDGLAVKEATKQGYAMASVGDAVNFQFPDSNTRRGRVGKQIANTLEASNINQGVVTSKYRIRKLTPRECLRLQSVPEDVIDSLSAEFSDSRLYKFAGNGLTTNVIQAIGERIVTLLNGR